MFHCIPNESLYYYIVGCKFININIETMDRINQIFRWYILFFCRMIVFTLLAFRQDSYQQINCIKLEVLAELLTKYVIHFKMLEKMV